MIIVIGLFVVTFILYIRDSQVPLFRWSKQLVEGTETARSFVKSSIGTHEQEEFLDLLAGSSLFHSHAYMGPKRTTGPYLILIDDMLQWAHEHRTERLTSGLVDQQRIFKKIAEKLRCKIGKEPP